MNKHQRLTKYDLVPGIYLFAMLYNGVQIDIPGGNEGYSYKYEALGREIVDKIDDYKLKIEKHIIHFFPALQPGFVKAVHHIIFDRSLEGEQFRIEFSMDTTDGYLTMAAIFTHRNNISIIEMVNS